MTDQSLDRVNDIETMLVRFLHKHDHEPDEVTKYVVIDQTEYAPEVAKVVENLINSELQNLRQELVREIEAVLDGNRIDREATRKHIESCDILDDVKEVRILNMEIEADDLDDTINKISKEVLAIIKGEK